MPSTERLTLYRSMNTSLFTKTLRVLLASAAVLLIPATSAMAHEGAIGDGGPFRVEISTEDPAGVESRWGNGEVEFHVEPGTELIVLGLEKDQMVKVDKEGNMFANENSPSWWANQPEGTVPDSASATAEPNWVWKMAGGSMQFHDHRFHFMDTSINPETKDGDEIFTFALPLLVNGEPVEMLGSFIFDSTIDPAGAERLKSTPTMEPETMESMPMEENSEESSSSFPVVPVVIGVAVLIAAAGATVIARRR